MSDNTFTTTLALDKETTNYAVYQGVEFPNGQQVGGFYIPLAALPDNSPEYIEATFGDADSGAVNLVPEKASGEGNSIRYSSENGMVKTAYVWPSNIDSDQFGSAKSTDSAKTVGFSIGPSTEEAWDAIQAEADSQEEEEAAALAEGFDFGDGSEESEEEEPDESEALAEGFDSVEAPADD